MLVTLITILLFVYFWYQTNAIVLEPKRCRYEKRSLLIMCAILLFQTTFRYFIVGSDISGYWGQYLEYKSLSISEIIEEQPNYIAYYLISNFFSVIGVSFRGWLFLLELFYLSAILRIINKYSTDKIFSLFMFYTIGLYSFSHFGLKQTMAMAFAWHFIVEFTDKKYIRAGILFTLAYFSHKTALFFLFAPVLYLAEGMKRRTFFTIAIVVIFILALNAGFFINYFTLQLGDEQYIRYLDDKGDYSLSTFIFYIILFATAMWGNRKQSFLGSSIFIFSAALFSVLSQYLSQYVDDAFRLGLYYASFLTVYVPNGVRKDKTLSMLIVLFLTVWLLYSSRNLPYRFMWQ